MGVCTAERPVMHWQQSARFLCPPRERSPTLPGHHLIGQCGTSGNNNHPLYRPCASCPEPLCEHSNSRKTFGQSPTFNDSCRSFETPERTIFDESPLGFTEVNRGPASDCNDIHSSRSCLQLKTEPLGPSSPESNSDLLNTEDCAGCGRLIQDRFYLSAVEKRWHVGCLQCCICKQPLEGETSCYSRDGNIYCKSDYYRVFGTRRCSGCMASISSSELVMRARHLVFHVRCFSCTVCKAPLTKGDQFGMRESSVFCRLHYEITVDSHAGQNNIAQSAVLPMSCQYPTQFGASPNAPPSPTTDGTGLKIGASGFYSTGAHGLTGLPQAPRQKGRPRKRKPKDIDMGMTATLDLNSEYLTELGGFGRGGLGSSSRTKRMRTSFKHHQLRTMKSYFAINHNPDAKDLKALSQKTGLPKRVLQVWFQNARAKWRRMVMKQEGKGSLSDKGDGPLDLDSYNSHSPSFMMGAGPPSPHSMD